jgi:type II secretory pathway pseudopilin PulG
VLAVRTNGGFSLLEATVTTAVLAVVGLIAASILTNISTQTRTVFARAANVELANSLRLQLARRARAGDAPGTSCVSSLVTPPSTYGGPSAIAVRLSGGGPVVAAGAMLPDMNIDVTGLNTANVTSAGTSDNGNPIYLADVILSTRARGATGGATRDITVARLAFEIQGGALLACYASDTYMDVTQQLQNMCTNLVSPSGVPSTWSGGRCVTPDVNIATTCANIGGTWNGSSCSVKRTSFIVSRWVPAGAYNDGTGYAVTCPANSVLTGAACTSGVPPRIPVGGMYLNGWGANYFGCAWQLGYEDTDYTVYAACLR